MSADHQSTWILGLQGWTVKRDGVRLDGEIVVLGLERAPGRGYRCRRCGEGVLFAYDHLAPRLRLRRLSLLHPQDPRRHGRLTSVGNPRLPTVLKKEPK